MSSNHQPDTLLLFDIDGTMLHCGASARESLSQAISEITGQAVSLRVEDVAGSTDLGIIRNALTRLGIDEDEIPPLVPEIGRRYIEIVMTAYPERNDQYLYPGISELLEHLQSRDRFRLGLMTGNLYEGAQVKLRPFGIMDMFQVGAFGDDSPNRNGLPPIAWEKAEQELNETYRPERTMIIGDTPSDAVCARVNGVKALMVVRRPEWREEIQQHDPFRVVEDTENVEDILELMETFQDE